MKGEDGLGMIYETKVEDQIKEDKGWRIPLNLFKGDGGVQSI